MANDFSMTDQQRKEKMDRFAAKFQAEVVDNQKWEIETTDRYYYLSGRFSKTYVEVTFWYNPYTLTRKETKRQETISDGQEHSLPDWCKSCEYRKRLNYE